MGPSRVVKPGGNGMSGRGDRQQIHDHGLVKSCEAMVDVPRPLRRPMPIESIALRRLPVPVPLHCFPKLRDPPEEIFLRVRGTIEILPGFTTLDGPIRARRAPSTGRDGQTRTKASVT